MALGLALTIGTKVFNLLEIGKFRNIASTPDQPEDLTIQSSLNPSAVSSFVVKSTKNTNSLSIGAADDVSQVHVVFKYSPSTTQAQLEAQFVDLKTLLTPSVFAALMRGER